MYAALSSDQGEDFGSLLPAFGCLIDKVGDAQFPRELAQFLHYQLSAEHVHLVRVGKLEADHVFSASYDGSNAAARLTDQFYSRNLNRFEKDIVINEMVGPPQITVASDHTQSSSSPEFRSFGREVDIGSRFLIRRDTGEDAVVFTMLWPLQMGDVSHLQSKVSLLSHFLAPMVSKHISICERRSISLHCLGSVSKLEAILRRILGDQRPREVQVAARILSGRSATEIAAELSITRETVVFHRKRLYERTTVQTQRDFLLWYLARDSAGALVSAPSERIN